MLRDFKNQYNAKTIEIYLINRTLLIKLNKIKLYAAGLISVPKFVNNQYIYMKLNNIASM